MDQSHELYPDFKKYTEGLDPMTIEMIRLSERIKMFNNLRSLIQEKEYDNDLIAADILGWAYEKLGNV